MVQQEADAPLEDKCLRWVCPICDVVRTNVDYGLGVMTRLPDIEGDALAIFEAAELLATMFFALHLLVRAGRFSEEDLLISFRCLP